MAIDFRFCRGIDKGITIDGVNHIIVFVTAKNKKEAERMGRRLVSERLAACVNIIPGINSIFIWKNKLENAKEALLLIKTSQHLQPILFKRVRQIHKYEVPEVIGVPIKYIDKKYRIWLNDVLLEQ